MGERSGWLKRRAEHTSGASGLEHRASEVRAAVPDENAAGDVAGNDSVLSATGEGRARRRSAAVCRGDEHKESWRHTA